MSVEVRVPELGESIAEATVGAWLKREGDAVEAGEPLVELETEKVNLDVSAEQPGILERIEHKEGETVRRGEVLAVLGEDDSGRAGPHGSEGVAEAATVTPSPTRPVAQSDVERPHASSLARRIAQEHGVDLAEVAGSGSGGRVTREDVERHLQESGVGGRESGAATEAAPPSTPAPLQPSAAPVPGPSATAPDSRPSTPDSREERVPMSRRRQTIAQRLIEAQRTAAMLTTFNDVDMTAVMDLRARRREAFRERYGVNLGFMSFFTKAVVGALKAFPYLNAELRGQEIVLKKHYDIGIAVSADEGLVVPVLRDADRKSFGQIEQEIAALVERARDNKLTLDDLRGGTFTITNGGVFGSLLSTPILSTPQVGILGMHRIEQRPVARDGQVVIRPMMYLALSYDHRIVDGRDSVQFLTRVKQLIEDPEALMLES